MKESYIRAMDVLHKLCIFLAASCLVIMTLIIPYGVFTRYVLGSAASWPEPMAILLMIIFSFVAAAACYRDGLHIAVMAVPDMLSPRARLAVGWVAEIGMVAANLFMLIWGITLVEATMHQVIGEFPILSVGITYAPIPIGGGITLLFVIERMWTGNIFAKPNEASIGSLE
jgi:TRAP-type C4-dicarboxylate transport system permease small subunit